MSVPRPAMLVEMVTAPGRAGPGDDRGLELVVLGVEDLARDARPGQGRGELLRFPNARRPHKDGTARGVDGCDLPDEGLALGLPVSEHDVGQVPAHARPVGRHDDDAEAVEFLELSRRGLGRGRHAAKRRIEPEEVLERDRAEDAPLGAAPHPLLGLDGGLEAVGPMPLVHDPAGELVDDLDAAVADDVIDVALEQELGVEGAVDRGQELFVPGSEEVAAAEDGLDAADARVGREDVGVLGVRLEVAAPLEVPDDGGQPRDVEAGRAGGPGDDERDPGFVDEDGVGLIDEGHGERPVDEFAGLVGQPVPQVIEAGLLGGGVRDIAGIGGLLGGLVQALLDGADGQAEEAVGRAHPGRVAAGQVIVEGQHVDGPAEEGEVRGGEHGRQRLALPGRELGDPAVGHGQPGDELDVVGVEPGRAAGGFERQGEDGHAHAVFFPRRGTEARRRRPAERRGPPGDLGVGDRRELFALVRRADRPDRPRVRREVGFDGDAAKAVEGGLELANGRLDGAAPVRAEVAFHRGPPLLTGISARQAGRWRRSARRTAEEGRTGKEEGGSSHDARLAPRPDREKNAEDDRAEGEGQGQEEDGQYHERDRETADHRHSPFTAILGCRRPPVNTVAHQRRVDRAGSSASGGP